MKSTLIVTDFVVWYLTGYFPTELVECVNVFWKMLSSGFVEVNNGI